jgi:hypothetical protein
MTFPYDRITGRIDPENDSEAVRGYKAGAGAFFYALRNAGWSPEQITNSMRTLFDSTAEVLAEHLRIAGEDDIAECGNPMWAYAAAEITPEPRADHCQCSRCPKCPCRPHYCNACHPERT